MDLVTVACERDIQDLLLQAHSIDKFIQEPCHHWITVEDESLTPDEWHGILSPYYTRHKLNLTFSKRPDLEFYEPFNLGWRRQQELKLTAVANCVSDRAMVLDAKNFFIRPTILEDISIRHGNGRYTDVLPPMAKLWHDYLCDELKIPSPPKFPAPLSTPTIYDVNLVKRIPIEGVFLQDVVPAGEVLYYFFHVEDQFDAPSDILLGALMVVDDPNDIPSKIEEARNSYTHGLHRRFRNMMPEISKQIYENWLISLGLNKALVKNYVYYNSNDKAWY